MAVAIPAAGASATVAVIASANAEAATPTPTTSYALVAWDNYNRVVRNGLGKLDRGGVYKVMKSAGVGSAVSAGRANVTNLKAGGSFHAQATSVQLTNTRVRATVTVPTRRSSTVGFYYGLDLRAQPNGSMYRAKVKVLTDSALITIVRHINNVDVVLAQGTVRGRLAASTRLVLDAQVTGTANPTLSVRAWIDGTTAPGWQLVAVDRQSSAITKSGTIGSWAYQSAAGATAAFAQSELRVWNMTVTAAPKPAPTTSSAAPVVSTSEVPTSTAPTSDTPTSDTPTSDTPTSDTPTSDTPTSDTPTTGSSTPSPPPVDPPTTEPARGSAPVGTTTFAVPANAIVVSPSGRDTGAGTLSDPLRTVTAALSKAKTGQTIVLRGGTYHEWVTISRSDVTIESYPHEAVWFDGSSSVSGWSKRGATWVHSGWTTKLDHSASFTYGQDGTNGWSFIGPQNPMAAWPDAVWLAGSQLRQVGSAAEVVAGTFFVDYTNQELVLGTDPTGQTVEASDLAQAFKVLAPGVTLQGFGVRRYATSLPGLGTMHFQGGSETVRDVVATENATQAITFHGPNNLIDHVSATLNGMVGVGGNLADNTTLSNSILSGNNAQLFNTSPSAAGSKITRSRGLTITNNLFADNNANGLWLDQADVNFVVANNTFTGNYIGSQIELADTGIVANNVYNGGKFGLYIYDTGNVKVYNNSFTNNPTGSVFMLQDQRRQSDPSYWKAQGDTRYPAGDPTDPWLLRNVQVYNNYFLRAPAGGLFQVYALDKKTNIAADTMNISIRGNDFSYRDVSAQPNLVGWGGNDNVTVTRYNTPDALRAKNSSWRNLQHTSDTYAASVADDDSVAVALPADVAAAIGVPTGTQHIGPF